MSDERLHIPVVVEEAVVAARPGAVERVRVRTGVETREELVTGELHVEAIEIERRAVERRVDAAPPPRQEGDTLVVSIVEERAVVTRQLVVVEEIVLRRRATAEPFAVPVALRRTRAEVDRTTVLPDQQEKN